MRVELPRQGRDGVEQAVEVLSQQVGVRLVVELLDLNEDQPGLFAEPVDADRRQRGPTPWEGRRPGAPEGERT